MIVELHGKSNCSRCQTARNYLDEHGVRYLYLLHDDDAERQAFYDQLGLKDAARIMPQVIIVDGDDKQQVGSIEALVNSGIGSLKHLLTSEKQDVVVSPTASIVRYEPVFTLRAGDLFALPTVVHWIMIAAAVLGEDHVKVVGARQRLAEMRDWQKTHGNKLPD